jgi:type IV pilus assembly protein PilB
MPNTDDSHAGAVQNLINQMLISSIKVGASDIHIEPHEENISIRFRVDGDFHHFETVPKDILGTLSSRIKVMSDLKVDQKNVPQDGVFSTKFQEKSVNFRVATFPFIYGEKIVMRLLVDHDEVLPISDLGFLPNVTTKVEKALHMTNGMILVVGPTGSGKTTILTSLVSHYNPKKKNIATVEDPVEYRLPGVNHASIRNDIGFGFAEASKALMRQDPDVIMVGEVRDKNTANTLIEASLSGHIALSSMHTNSASASIERLRHFGIDNILIASSLRMIISQRLGRQICPHCREKYPLPNKYKYLVEQEILPKLPNKKIEDVYFYRGKGCEQCNLLGYKGRIGFYEVLEVTPDIEEMIIKDNPAMDIHEKALSEGMLAIHHDALLKAMMGDTSIEEAIKVMT